MVEKIEVNRSSRKIELPKDEPVAEETPTPTEAYTFQKIVLYFLLISNIESKVLFHG